MITFRRLVISVLLALSLVGLAYGFSSARDTTKPPVYTDPAVEGTFPKEGDLDLRQARIGIDLASGFQAAIKLDDREIPDDQVEKVVGLDQYFYTPGPGTETGALSPGRHCAAAVIWGVAETRDQGRDFVWCFQVH